MTTQSAVEKGVFTRKELAAEMARVDASDGKVDGQFTGALREDECKS